MANDGSTFCPVCGRRLTDVRANGIGYAGVCCARCFRREARTALPTGAGVVPPPLPPPAGARPRRQPDAFPGNRKDGKP